MKNSGYSRSGSTWWMWQDDKAHQLLSESSQVKSALAGLLTDKYRWLLKSFKLTIAIEQPVKASLFRKMSSSLMSFKYTSCPSYLNYRRKLTRCIRVRCKNYTDWIFFYRSEQVWMSIALTAEDGMVELLICTWISMQYTNVTDHWATVWHLWKDVHLSLFTKTEWPVGHAESNPLLILLHKIIDATKWTNFQEKYSSDSLSV